MGLAAFFPPSHAFSPSQAPSSPCTMTDRPHHQGPASSSSSSESEPSKSASSLCSSAHS
ncbi:unnamed protein product, partial [Ascophyllum nodosum]